MGKIVTWPSSQTCCYYTMTVLVCECMTLVGAGVGVPVVVAMGDFAVVLEPTCKVGVWVEVSLMGVISIPITEGVGSEVRDGVLCKAEGWELAEDGASRVLCLNLL